MSNLNAVFDTRLSASFQSTPESRQDSLLDKEKLIARLQSGISALLLGEDQRIVEATEPNVALNNFVAHLVSGVFEPCIISKKRKKNCAGNLARLNDFLG